MLINIYICDKNAIKFPPFSLKCEIVILDGRKVYCRLYIFSSYFGIRIEILGINNEHVLCYK